MFKIQALVDFVVHVLKRNIWCCRKLWCSNNYCYNFNENNCISIDVKTRKVNEKMRDLQPELDKIKEKYKDNPQEYQKRTAEIYKENNVILKRMSAYIDSNADIYSFILCFQRRCHTK